MHPGICVGTKVGPLIWMESTQNITSYPQGRMKKKVEYNWLKGELTSVVGACGPLVFEAQNYVVDWHYRKPWTTIVAHME